MKYQQWNIAQRSQEAYKAMERQGVPTLVAATLCARGMTDLAEAKGLLSSGEDQLQDPFLMKDMDLATARIGRALRNGEKIAVYGDYDVDGITSTCLLTHYLRAQGGDVCYYIPNRLSEGYGVNREAVEELARQGVRLMITVDCGITAVEEVAYASGLGIDVIITDHHECKEEIPAAVAVVDPHRKDCPYPFKDLAGVGVALKLVMALGGEKRYRALFQEYADLAAVGTVADVMKLLGENRTIVRVGLNHLKKTRRRGLYALMVEAGTLNRAITSTTVGDRADVAFYPQINEYRGSRSVQLHLVDLRPAYSAQQLNEQALYRKYSRGEPLSPCEARMMIPQREEFAAVWRYLANRDGEVVEVPASLARKVAQEGDLWESTLHTMICLEVLESFDLVTLRPEEGGALRIRLQKRRGKGKVALYQAPIIQKLQAIAWGEERRSHLSS